MAAQRILLLLKRRVVAFAQSMVKLISRVVKLRGCNCTRNRMCVLIQSLSVDRHVSKRFDAWYFNWRSSESCRYSIPLSRFKIYFTEYKTCQIELYCPQWSAKSIAPLTNFNRIIWNRINANFVPGIIEGCRESAKCRDTCLYGDW